jgi:hypothetical protein
LEFYAPNRPNSRKTFRTETFPSHFPVFKDEGVQTDPMKISDDELDFLKTLQHLQFKVMKEVKSKYLTYEQCKEILKILNWDEFEF